MKINKLIYITLLTLIINGCTSTAKKKESICLSKTSDIFTEGSVGIRVQDNFNTGKFKISFIKDYFKMTINDPLGFGTKIFEKGPFGLKIDGKEQNLDFNDWMFKEYGWNFPLERLPKILLENHKTVEYLSNWNTQILKRQGVCNYSRVIKFTHKNKDIQVKLVIRNIRLN